MKKNQKGKKSEQRVLTSNSSPSGTSVFQDPTQQYLSELAKNLIGFVALIEEEIQGNKVLKDQTSKEEVSKDLIEAISSAITNAITKFTLIFKEKPLLEECKAYADELEQQSMALIGIFFLIQRQSKYCLVLKKDLKEVVKQLLFSMANVVQDFVSSWNDSKALENIPASKTGLVWNYCKALKEFSSLKNGSATQKAINSKILPLIKDATKELEETLQANSSCEKEKEERFEEEEDFDLDLTEEEKSIFPDCITIGKGCFSILKKISDVIEFLSNLESIETVEWLENVLKEAENSPLLFDELASSTYPPQNLDHIIKYSQLMESNLQNLFQLLSNSQLPPLNQTPQQTEQLTMFIQLIQTKMKSTFTLLKQKLEKR